MNSRSSPVNASPVGDHRLRSSSPPCSDSPTPLRRRARSATKRWPASVRRPRSSPSAARGTHERRARRRRLAKRRGDAGPAPGHRRHDPEALRELGSAFRELHLVAAVVVDGDLGELSRRRIDGEILGGRHQQQEELLRVESQRPTWTRDPHVRALHELRQPFGELRLRGLELRYRIGATAAVVGRRTELARLLEIDGDRLGRSGIDARNARNRRRLRRSARRDRLRRFRTEVLRCSEAREPIAGRTTSPSHAGSAAPSRIRPDGSKTTTVERATPIGNGAARLV